MMKTSHIFGIALLSISLVFVLITAAFNQPPASAQSLGATASLSTQITPTPITDGAGSTDGILIMGFVIMLIIIIPIIIYNKKS